MTRLADDTSLSDNPWNLIAPTCIAAKVGDDPADLSCGRL